MDKREGEKIGLKISKDSKKVLYTNPNPLPEPLRTWRCDLKRLWLEEKDTKIEKIQKFLESDIFLKVTNPFEIILTLTEHSPDFATQKANSLAGTIIRQFEIWIGNPVRMHFFDGEYFNQAIQIRAFKVATEKHTVHLDVIIRAFRLATGVASSSTTEIFISLIRNMTKNGNFKDACHCICLLNLFCHFAKEDVVLPCILQDRLIQAEEYMKQAGVELQIEIVKYLDGLLSVNADLDMFLNFWRKKGVIAVKRERFEGKTLQKLVSRLRLAFELADEATPQLQRVRTQGSIRHVAYKRFIEQSLSEANFTDYVEDAINEYPEMQRYFLDVLTNMKQYDEATKWVVRLEMERSLLPNTLYRYMNGHPRTYLHVSSFSKKSIVTKGSLCLPKEINESIRLIDTKTKLDECLAQIFSAAENEEEFLIGLDTEWRPLFLCSSEKVALMQIATKTGAFLIDFIILEKLLSEQEWVCFFERIFGSENALKLGFDFTGDFRTLISTLPFCRQVLSNTKRVVCLARLVKYLCNANSYLAEDLNTVKDEPSTLRSKTTDANSESYPAIPSISSIPSPDQSQLDQSLIESLDGVGQNLFHFKLSDLCLNLLHKSLDKSEQFGNWAKRPLRPEQLHYAALDAYCQLEIYELLKKKAESVQIDWDQALKASLVGTCEQLNEEKRSKGKKSRKKVGDVEFSALIERLNAALLVGTVESRTPRQLRLAVDSMVRGLGKHLRRCGIDCAIPEYVAAGRNELIRLARQDGRIILSTGKAYLALLPRIPKNLLCVSIINQGSLLSQLEFVLDHFHIRVRKEDIFSRCILCNSCRFLYAPAPLLEAVYKSVVVSNDLFLPIPFNRAFYFDIISKLAASDYNNHEINVIDTGNDEELLVDCDGEILEVISGVIMTHGRVRVKIEQLFPTSFDESKLFFVCTECGKIYWDGSHIDNYIDKYRHTIIDKDDK